MSKHSGWVVCLLMAGAGLSVTAYLVAAQTTGPVAAAGVSREFPAYGGGPRQIRYSPLTEITKSNVQHLAVAWEFDTGEPGAMQTQPIVKDGVLYGYTPTHKTFALKADTGDVLWTFDSGIRGTGPNRGVMLWTGDGRTRSVRCCWGLRLRARLDKREANHLIWNRRPDRPARASGP